MGCISHTQLRRFFLSLPERNGDGDNEDRDDTDTDADDDDSDSSSILYSVNLKYSVHSVPGRSFRRSFFLSLLVRMIPVLVLLYIFSLVIVVDGLWLFLSPTTISSPEDKAAEAIKKILAAAAHPFQEHIDVVIVVVWVGC